MSAHTFSQDWEWVRSIGGYDMDLCKAVATDNLGNIYVLGEYHSSSMFSQLDTLPLIGSKDCFLMKLDKNGDEHWIKRIGSTKLNIDSGEYVSRLVIDTVNNSIYVSGMFFANLLVDTVYITGSPLFRNYFVAKFDSDGHCLWVNNAGSCGSAGVNSLLIESNGNVVTLIHNKGGGTISGLPVVPGLVMVKMDPNGNIFMAKSISPNSSGSISSINNDYVISGVTDDGIDSVQIDTIKLKTHGFSHDIFISRFDSSGNVKWAQVAGGAGFDFVSGVRVDGQNNIYTYGYTYGQSNNTCYFQNDSIVSPNGTDVYLYKCDENGTLIWLKSLQTSITGNSGYAVGLDVNDNVYINGTFSGSAVFGNDTISASSVLDMFITAYSPSGVCLGADHLQQTEGLSLAIDFEGNVVAVGNFGYQIIAGNDTVQTVALDDGYIIKRASFTTGIVEQRLKKNNLVIYANPTTGICRVQLPLEFQNEQELYFNLIDNSGRVLESKIINKENGLELNLNTYAKGIYIVTLSSKTASYKGNVVFE